MLTMRWSVTSGYFALCIVLSFTLSVRVPAQSTVVVRGDGASCTQCGLALRDPIILRVPDTAAALFSPFVFRTDSRSRYYFTDPFRSPEIRVFGPDGKFIRTIGRRGNAPGEFMRVDAMEFGTNDTLHVFGHAHTVFDPDGRHIRTTAFRSPLAPTGSTRLNDGRLILVGSVNTAEQYGHPFHAMAGSDAIERSFGLPAQASTVGPWSSQRVVAPHGAHGLVSLRVNDYEMEVWSNVGVRSQVIRREQSWFQPWVSWNSRADLNPPPPRILSVAVDDSGHVWTLISVADANWRRTASGTGEGSLLNSKQLSDSFDSIIEIIDIRAGRVVAASRFPEMLVAMPRAGVAIENIIDEQGEVTVRVWKVLPVKRD